MLLITPRDVGEAEARWDFRGSALPSKGVNGEKLRWPVGMLGKYRKFGGDTLPKFTLPETKPASLPLKIGHPTPQ